MSSTLPPTGDDSTFNPAPDPRLDALLQQALGRGGLAPSVKSAQLTQMGLGGFAHSRTRQETAGPSGGAASPGGAAGAAAVRAGRSGRAGRGGPNSIGGDDIAPSFHREVVWEDAPRRRIPRFAGFAAVISAVLVVVLLFTLLPDNDAANLADATATPERAASPGASPSVSPAATVDEQQTPTTDPSAVLEADSPGRVYVIGERTAQAGVRGEVLALDATSGITLFTIDVDTRVDAAVSPDGGTLYVAWSPADGGDDQLAAYDALDGAQRWQVSVPGRIWLEAPQGAQPASGLVVSSGGQVSVVLCPTCDADPASQRVQRVYNGADGNVLGEAGLGTCDGAVYQHQMVGSAIVICEDQPAQRITMQNGAQPLFDDGPLAERPPDAFVSGPGDGTIYFLSGNRVSRVNGPTGLVVGDFEVAPELLASSGRPFIMPSSTGLRLFIGPFPGGATGTDVAVISTRTYDEDLRFTTNPPLNTTIVAPGRDGRSLLGVSTTLHDGGVIPQDAIVRYSLDGRSETLLTLTGFTTQRLLSAAAPRAVAMPSANTLLALATDGAGQASIVGLNVDDGREVLRVPVAANPDVAAPTNGTSLYVGSGDALFALDLISNTERWRITWPNRTAIPPESGPSAMAVSPDGTRLYVRSSAPRGPDTGDHFIQIFSAEDGTPLGELPNAGGCAGRTHFSPDGRWLWIVCLGDTPMQIINLETGEQYIGPADMGTVVGSVTKMGDPLLHVLSVANGVYEARTFMTTAGNSAPLATVVVAVASDDPLVSLGLFGITANGSHFIVGLGSEQGSGNPQGTTMVLQTREATALPVTFALEFPVTVPGMVQDSRLDRVLVAGWDGAQTSVQHLGVDQSPVVVATTSLRLTRLIGTTNVPIGAAPQASASCIPTQPTQITYTFGNQTRTVPEYRGNGISLRLQMPSAWFSGGMLATWQVDQPGAISAQALPVGATDGRAPVVLDRVVDQLSPTEQRVVIDLAVGCWEIVASTPEATFRAMVDVYPSDIGVVTADEQLAAEQRRADLTPYPVPESCMTSDSNLYLSVSGGGTPSWRFGMVSLPDGVLFTGENVLLLEDRVSTGQRESPAQFTVIATHESGVSQPLVLRNLTPDGSIAYDDWAYRGWWSQVTFDTPGCWMLQVSTPIFSETATVYVYPEQVGAILQQRGAEHDLVVADPPPSCAAPDWTGPEWRLHAVDASAYWLDGEGLALGSRLGMLVVGENTVDWLRVRDFGSDVPIDEPIVLTGTRMDPRVGVEDTFALTTTLVSSWPDGAVTSDTYDHAWRSVLTIPEPGCWAVSAQFGTQRLDAVLWVTEPA